MGEKILTFRSKRTIHLAQTFRNEQGCSNSGSQCPVAVRGKWCIMHARGHTRPRQLPELYIEPHSAVRDDVHRIVELRGAGGERNVYLLGKVIGGLGLAHLKLEAPAQPVDILGIPQLGDAGGEHE